MKKKEELFFLIKSMTKSEKRYFKLVSKANGENNNYLRLFNSIDCQDQYDEDTIKRKFENEIFIKQLTTTKNYLRNLILKALRLYRSQISKDAIVKDCLRNTEILYQKGLYRLALFEAEKANKIARKYEIQVLIFDALSWKKRILQAIDPQQSPELKEIADEQNAITSFLKDYSSIWLANLNIAKSGLKDLPIISKGEPLQNKIIKRLYIFQQNLQTGAPDKAVRELETIISEYDQLPYRRSEDAESYLVILNNLVAFYVFKKNYNNALSLILKLKEFVGELKDFGAPVLKTLLRAYNIELEIYREIKDLEKGEKLISEINVYLEESFRFIPPSYVLSFWFQFAYVKFLTNKNSDALKWINLLLGKRSDKLREDLISYAYWLNLMVHFELKNYFVLRYFVDSTRRHLQKRRKITNYEKLLLRLFTSLVRLPKGEVKPTFKEYRIKLSKEENKIPDQVIDYIDFYAWLDQKIK